MRKNLVFVMWWGCGYSDSVLGQCEKM